MGKTGPVYYLVAGRWFSAPDFTGPWTFATPKLPDDFKNIPLEHERSRVLASVPGTDQAIEAVLLAQIPQTARVDRTKIEAPPVSYNGAPEFTAIEGTSLQRAVNTDKDIILSGGVYYYCNQGVWFTEQGRRPGRGQVATTIPAEIYKIPASSPSHHVTYVVVEDDDNDNDEWVTFAYAAGYTGLMIGWGCAVWGSGWYYPPYVATAGHPSTTRISRRYGYSAHYNPWTGCVRTERRRVRTVRRRGRERALQPAHRHLLARRGGMGTVWRERRRAGLQPAHRRRTGRRGRARTSTAAGDRRRCSAAMTGRRPIASPIARPAPRRASPAPTRARRSAATLAARAGGFVAAGDERQRLRRPRRQRL